MTGDHFRTATIWLLLGIAILLNAQNWFQHQTLDRLTDRVEQLENNQ